MLEDDLLLGKGETFKRGKSTPPATLRQAMIHCIRHREDFHYGGDRPSDPPGEWINDVHALVQEELDLEDSAYLRVYPGVGDRLDKKQIDFYITYEDPKTKKFIVVSIDITTDRSKLTHGYEADITLNDCEALANPTLFPGMEGGEFRGRGDDSEASRKGIAKVIAQVFRYKLEHGDRYHDLGIQAEVRRDIQDLLGDILDEDGDGGGYRADALKVPSHWRADARRRA